MDLLDLFVKVGVKDEASDKVGKIGEGVKNALGGAAKVAGVAIGAASTAVGALGKQAVDAYADYEQLVGGVETLFGAGGKTFEEYAQAIGDSTDVAKEKYASLMNAQQEVLDNAEQAYKTAGMSINDYMETVTGMSASLIQSLGGDTEEAAKKADQAIIDMSDNANKMGSDISSIQNAYSGFAKGNYTMLDNLKLGYGGTKEEMERLLEEAEKISGIEYDISSYADIVDAIHVVQTEMGITGTTAEEAASTISGSLAMTSASWQNLVASLGDANADTGAAIDVFVENVETSFNNILPIAEQALLGIGELVTGLAPILGEKIPGIITDVLPTLLEAAVTLVTALSTGLIENIPLLMDAGLNLIESLITYMLDHIDEIIDTAINLVMTITDTLIEHAPQLVEAAIELIAKLTWGILQRLPEVIAKGVELVMAIIQGIANAYQKLMEKGMELVMKLAEAIGSKLSELVAKGREIIDSVKSGVMEKIEQAKTWGKDLIANFISGIKEKWEALKSTVSNVAETVKDFLGFSEPEKGPLSNFHTYGPDMMKLYAEGIRDNMWMVENALKEMPVPGVSSEGTSVIHNYIEIGGQPLLDFVNEGLGAMA